MLSQHYDYDAAVQCLLHTRIRLITKPSAVTSQHSWP